VWGARFVDILLPVPGGTLRLDYTHFDDVEPLRRRE